MKACVSVKAFFKNRACPVRIVMLQTTYKTTPSPWHTNINIHAFINNNSADTIPHYCALSGVPWTTTSATVRSNRPVWNICDLKAPCKFSSLDLCSIIAIQTEKLLTKRQYWCPCQYVQTATVLIVITSDTGLLIPNQPPDYWSTILE